MSRRSPHPSLRTTGCIMSKYGPNTERLGEKEGNGNVYGFGGNGGRNLSEAPL